MFFLLFLLYTIFSMFYAMQYLYKQQIGSDANLSRPYDFRWRSHDGSQKATPSGLCESYYQKDPPYHEFSRAKRTAMDDTGCVKITHPLTCEHHVLVE